MHAIPFAHIRYPHEQRSKRRDVVVHGLLRSLTQFVELHSRGLSAVDGLESTAQSSDKVHIRRWSKRFDHCSGRLMNRIAETRPPVERGSLQQCAGESKSAGVVVSRVPLELLLQFTQPSVECDGRTTVVLRGRWQARALDPWRDCSRLLLLLRLRLLLLQLLLKKHDLLMLLLHLLLHLLQ